MFRISLAATLLALFLVLPFASAQALHKGQVSFTAPVVPTTQSPFRVTFTGANFSTDTAFRLSSNASSCDATTEFAYDATPPGTISNIVKWNIHDSDRLVVAEFTVGQAQAQVFVCMTRNLKTWHIVNNNRNRPHFHLWRKLPTAYIVPRTPTEGQPVQVFVRNIPQGAVAALVKQEDGCDGFKPRAVLKGCNMSAAVGETNGFWFRPMEKWDRVFVCVSTLNHLPTGETDWTRVPFDPDHAMVHRNGHFEFPEDPSSPVTHRVPYSSHFRVYAASSRWTRGDLSCTPIVAGAPTECYIHMANETSVRWQDFQWLALKDGAGVTDCPGPKFFQKEIPNRVYFRWTPQQWGREGSAQALFMGRPLFFNDNAMNQHVLTSLPNGTKYGVGRHLLDMATTRFVVQPGFADQDEYGYGNLFALHSFAPLTNVDIQKGIPGHALNGSETSGEVWSVGLKAGQTGATITQQVALPAGASKCRMRALYNFQPSEVDFTAQHYLGSVKLVAATSVPADIETLRTFTLYGQGCKVSVGGGPRTGAVDGDIRAWETVGFDFNVLPSYGQARIELELSHQYADSIYFAEPELKCSSAAHTYAPDVAALQRVWTDVGSASTKLLRWRDGGAFNGDPCLNHWQGVVCRHLRVVELQLEDSELSGAFPSVPELSMLERLNLRGNSLRGEIPAGMANHTRLRWADFSRNQLTSIPPELFGANGNTCLKALFLQNNRLTRFPRHLLDSPSLECVNLAWNSLHGEVPNFDPLMRLTELNLAHNNLFGPLPLLPHRQLITADFSDNGFNGTIPKEWGQLQQLEFLDVSHNGLSGRIPPELATVRSAGRLLFRAQDNYLSGLVPNLPFLRYDLRNNIFACPLPDGFHFAYQRQLVGVNWMDCDYAQIV